MTIQQVAPWFGDEELLAMIRYLESGGWLTEFRVTAELEKAIAKYTGVKHCIMMPNGTLALYAALKCAHVRQEHHVIVPAFTMIATANAVRMCGAWPVFVDIDPETLCMDLDLLESRIGVKVKAIIPVALNGRAPDMNRLRELAKKHNITVIEDAAQALGSIWNGKHLGTFGDAGIISFSTPKVISMGQGGCVLTDNDELDREIRLFKNFGREKAGQQVEQYQCFGINLKFTDLQAIIGLEQMKKLPGRAQRKKEMFARYQHRLRGLPGTKFLPTDLDEVSPWYIDIMVEDREGLIDHLNENDIRTRSFYPALNTVEQYAWYYAPATSQEYKFPHAEYVAKHGLWLPSSSFLTDEQIDHVCERIRAFYG